jgi:hypothetical protein
MYFFNKIDMRPLRSWINQSRSMRRKCCISSLDQLFIRVLLVLLPFRIFMKWYTRKIAAGRAYGNYSEIIEWAQAVRVTGNVLKSTCLVQACVLKYRATETVLKIGVRNQENGFEAHAWVEFEGQIILGKLPEFSFVPIWEVQ